MIQKLRWKMTAIMMAIVTVLLLAVFVMLYSSSCVSYQRRSFEALRATVRRAVPKPMPLPADHRGPGPRDELPMLLLEEQADGSLLILSNRLFPEGELEKSDAEALIALIKASGEDYGLLKDEHLRYLREIYQQDQTTRYAITDTYAEEHALKSQLIHSAVIGSFALTVFFFLSLLLSKWAVRPVETAWEQQQQFISDASHELKTPLTVILANSNLVLQSEPQKAPDGRQNLLRIRHIQAEALRMKELVESLLTLARSDSGREYTPHQPLDLTYLVNAGLAGFEPIFFEAGKSLSSEIEDGIRMNGNEKKLRQLLEILLDNACKYSKDGGLIEVRLVRQPQRHSREVLLSVTSEGTPLSAEDTRRIFFRFYRADPSRGLVSGYGLGLSIAQNIVKEHRGTIQARSDGKEKNTFLVTFPI